MIGFALSGGGNRGALEIGALKVLLQQGTEPDLLAGSSAGAMVCAYLAAWWDEADEPIRQLEGLWLQQRGSELFGPAWTRPLRAAVRFLLGKPSFLDSTRVRQLVEASLPPGVTTFGDLTGPRLYIATASLQSGDILLFGDGPSDRLVDAVMGSAALPPVLPPVDYGQHQLVDGGTVDNVPARIAVEKGATEVWILDVASSSPTDDRFRTAIAVARRSLSILVQEQIRDDLEAARRSGAEVEYVPITFRPTDTFDINPELSAEMIAEGERQMREYLADPGARLRKAAEAGNRIAQSELDRG